MVAEADWIVLRDRGLHQKVFAAEVEVDVRVAGGADPPDGSHRTPQWRCGRFAKGEILRPHEDLCRARFWQAPVRWKLARTDPDRAIFNGHRKLHGFADKVVHEGVRGLVIDLIRRPNLLDLAVSRDDDAAGDLKGFRLDRW